MDQFVIILLIPILLTIMHEFAHAVVAWLVGMRVSGITLGTGPRLFRLQLGGKFLETRAIPAGGVCWATQRENYRKRWPLVMMIAAGPAA